MENFVYKVLVWNSITLGECLNGKIGALRVYGNKFQKACCLTVRNFRGFSIAHQTFWIIRTFSEVARSVIELGIRCIFDRMDY